MAEFLRVDQNLYAQHPFEQPIAKIAKIARLRLPVVREMMTRLADGIVTDSRYSRRDRGENPRWNAELTTLVASNTKLWSSYRKIQLTSLYKYHQVNNELGGVVMRGLGIQFVGVPYWPDYVHEYTWHSTRPSFRLREPDGSCVRTRQFEGRQPRIYVSWLERLMDRDNGAFSSLDAKQLAVLGYERGPGGKLGRISTDVGQYFDQRGRVKGDTD